MSRFFLFFMLFAAIPDAAIAAMDCGRMENAKAFFQCSTAKHPGSSISEATMQAAEAASSKGGQFLNPELSLKNTVGRNGGEKIASLEGSILFPLSDYLFLRTYRSDSADAEKLLLETEAKEMDFELKRSVIKDMYRYRQLQSEDALVDETLKTFASIERQFKSRRARGPEQEITLNLVELAQGDYELKKNHIVIEKQEIETRFKMIWGNSFELQSRWLPAYRKEWPRITPEFRLANHFEFQKSLAAQNKAAAEKSLAVAESWPKVTAGPVLERTAEGPGVFNTYGAALTVDLPLFSWNSGGRALARAQKARADLEHEIVSRSTALENEVTFRQYESAVLALKKSESRENLAKKHTMIDNLFRQGLTSGSTIIEAHRQIWEFTESQHEHELTALNSLLSLYLLQGKAFDEVLQ